MPGLFLIDHGKILKFFKNFSLNHLSVWPTWPKYGTGISCKVFLKLDLKHLCNKRPTFCGHKPLVDLLVFFSKKIFLNSNKILWRLMWFEESLMTTRVVSSVRDCEIPPKFKACPQILHCAAHQNVQNTGQSLPSCNDKSPIHDKSRYMIGQLQAGLLPRMIGEQR